jgi:hypothetical protein
MRSQRVRMLGGEPYRADDPELVAGRKVLHRSGGHPAEYVPATTEP